MLDENTVTTAVAGYLERSGYEIVQTLSTTEKGVDLIARNRATGARLLVESKGGTSTMTNSARFGRAFTQTQVFDRVAKGFYTAAVRLAGRKHPSQDKVALAMPDTVHFRRYATDVKPAAEKLGIALFLVSDDLTVSAL